MNTDMRRPNKVVRFKPVDPQAQNAPPEDAMPEYMNILGMIFSMGGLMMRMKWCSWVAFICSCVSFANARSIDDTKQILSSFIYALMDANLIYTLLEEPNSSFPTFEHRHTGTQNVVTFLIISAYLVAFFFCILSAELVIHMYKRKYCSPSAAELHNVRKMLKPPQCFAHSI